jgi:hypothetical protein
MILYRTHLFRGDILSLLQMTTAEALECQPTKPKKTGQGSARRLLWLDMAFDTDSQLAIPLAHIARLHENVVWAVGIWTPGYFFVLEGNEVVVMPKEVSDNVHDTNWIGFDEFGNLRNLGIEP